MRDVTAEIESLVDASGWDTQMHLGQQNLNHNN